MPESPPPPPPTGPTTSRRTPYPAAHAQTPEYALFAFHTGSAPGDASRDSSASAASSSSGSSGGSSQSQSQSQSQTRDAHPYPPNSAHAARSRLEDKDQGEDQGGLEDDALLRRSDSGPRLVLEPQPAKYQAKQAPKTQTQTQTQTSPQSQSQSSSKWTSQFTSKFTPKRKPKWNRHWLDRTRALLRANTGLLLVGGSQVFLSLMNVAVKTLNGVDPPVPTLELVAVRMIITYICCMGYMLATGVPDPYLGPKGVRLLLVTRGAVGFFGLFGVYYSLQYLSLSDATVLTFLAPLCTAIAGALLLGERFTRREGVAGVVSLVGVVLIARPAAIFGDMGHSQEVEGQGQAEKGTPRERLVAVGVALIGVLGATGAYTSIRAIGKRAHPLHSMTFFSALCIIISFTAMIVNKTPVVVPTRIEWIALLLMIGIFGFLAQTLLTMGLQRETAGRGAMAMYSQIIFATILERIFFHAVPTTLSVVGTLLIISSALYVVLTKEKEKHGGEDSSRNGNGNGMIGLERVGAGAQGERDAELEEGLLASYLDAERGREAAVDERERLGGKQSSRSSLSSSSSLVLVLEKEKVKEGRM